LGQNLRLDKNSTSLNFSYIGLGRLIAITIQAVFFLIFAALLEPEVYGQFAVIVAIANTGVIFSLFGLNQTIVIFRAKKRTDLADQINTIVLVTSAAAALIILPINMFASIFLLSSSFFIMYQENLIGLKDYKKYFLSSIIKFSLMITIPFGLYFAFEVPGIILGLAISNFVACIPYFRKLKLRSFRELKNYHKTIIHNFGAEASISLPNWIDKLLVAPLFGFAIVGVYHFNLQVLTAISILPLITQKFFLAEESSGIKHKNLPYLIILGSIGIAIAAFVISPYFVNLFFPKFADGIPSLQILVLSIIPLSISSIYLAKLQAKESSKFGFSAIIRVGSLLILLALLGELYGLIGLSLAVLLSITANTIFTYFLHHKEKSEIMP